MSGEPMWHAPDGSVWLWSAERGDWSGMDPAKYGLGRATTEHLQMRFPGSQPGQEAEHG